MVQFGDSRTDADTQDLDTRGTSFGGITHRSTASSIIGWLETLTQGKLTLHPTKTDYGIALEASFAATAVPRATASKGLDQVAASTAAVVVVLLGTNDSSTALSAADPGKGNGARNSANTKSNIRYLIEYLTDPAKNAAANGGTGNLHNGQAKTVIICNEMPTGRYVANGGAITLSNARASQSGFFDFSRWLMTLGYDQTGGYSNVVVLNTYDAMADYTTIPDATVGRPAGKPAFGGGSTANADTFLPINGAQFDGLHPSAHGTYLATNGGLPGLSAFLTPIPAYLEPLMPTPSTAASFVTANAAMTSGAAGTITASVFKSVTGTMPTSIAVGGSNMTNVDLTISSRDDTDGQKVWRFTGSGLTTTTSQATCWVGFSLAKAAYASQLTVGDKLRFLSKVRLLGGTKVNGIKPYLYVSSDGSNAYNIHAENVDGQTNGTFRNYLIDAPASVNPGMNADFVPLVSALADTSFMSTNPTQPPFGNLSAQVVVELVANGTDAPIGSAIAFDFEIKGLGMRKVTGN